jgi:hypothetical protein
VDEGGSVDEAYLFMKRLREGAWGVPSLGNLEDVLGKSLDRGVSFYGAPFQLRGTRFLRGLVSRGLC